MPEQNPQCLVFLLDRYLSKLPSFAFENDIICLCPKAIVPADADHPCYHCAPVGRNTPSSMVKEMYAEAGIAEQKNNHSLSKSNGSYYFIQCMCTDHHSLRCYKRISNIHEHAASHKYYDGSG